MISVFIFKHTAWSMKLCMLCIVSMLFCMNTFAQENSKPSYLQHTIKKNTIETILNGLSLEEKAAQVLMVNIAGNHAVSTHDIRHFKSTTPGAIILFGYNIAKNPQQVHSYLASCTKSFQINAQKNKHSAFIPPLYAVDNEGGTVYRTRAITIPLEAPEYIAQHYSPDEAYRLYYNLGRQMVHLGFHLNLAPVAEPKTPDTVLKDRCYSSDTVITAQYASTALRGMQDAGLLAAVKHFPGNGNVDLHKGSAELLASYDQLKNYYCHAFMDCIQNHAAVILVSHVIIPSIEKVPFCFSKKGIQWLRSELGFSGLILTDDIVMEAVKQNGESPAENTIRALEAGCDMIMCTLQNVYPIIEKITYHARNNKVFLDRLNDAVYRILLAKQQVGLIDGLGNYIEKNSNWEEFEIIKNQQPRRKASRY